MANASLVNRCRVGVTCAVIVACCLLAAPTPAGAQAPPELERIGVQLHRDYLRLQPFELLDTQSGNVILTIPMLSLPGNAGRTLEFRLTYNANVMTVGVAPWVFGIAGMPMRVDEQATRHPCLVSLCERGSCKVGAGNRVRSPCTVGSV